jgi:hypothetical protein
MEKMLENLLFKSLGLTGENRLGIERGQRFRGTVDTSLILEFDFVLEGKLEFGITNIKGDVKFGGASYTEDEFEDLLKRGLYVEIN